MKRKKIIIISISLVITIIFAIFGGFLGLILSRNAQLNTIDFSEITGSSKKVVLFIGDGMGVNHVKATSSYYEKQMFMTSLEYQGMVSTFSNSLFSPTDSAAAASSLATGRKFNNKEVSRHNGIDITTISEKAKNKGLGVGIVTTDNLYGATPASFSSHANNRGDTKQIVLAQAKSNIDLFLGAGKTTFTQFVFKALGVTEAVTSPTFAILKTYHGKFTLHHFDTYRISTEEAIEAGFDEILNEKDSVKFIEWSENIAALLPDRVKKVNIKYVDENTRIFDIEWIH